jgi:hypothetical protein
VNANTEDHFCSFCGQQGDDQDRRLLGGLGAFVCEHCATRFVDNLSPEERWQATQQPPWLRMTDDELLQVLPEITRSGVQLDDFLHDWVDMLRERGVSWHQIGLALGVTRQAAWQRFTRVRKPLATAADQA